MATTHPAADFSQATWLKSSHSSANGECVEVAANPAVIAIRDSKAPSNPHLTLSARNWVSFLADVKHGRHDFGL